MHFKKKYQNISHPDKQRGKTCDRTYYKHANFVECKILSSGCGLYINIVSIV